MVAGGCAIMLEESCQADYVRLYRNGVKIVLLKVGEHIAEELAVCCEYGELRAVFIGIGYIERQSQVFGIYRGDLLDVKCNGLGDLLFVGEFRVRVMLSE